MKSMTAYAHVQKQQKGRQLQLILRSLNYKYLDVFVHNLPPEKLYLEETIKREIKKKILRGRVEVFVFLRQEAAGQMKMDDAVVARYMKEIQRISRKYRVRNDVTVRDVLTLPQVIRWEEKKGSSETMLVPALREALKKMDAFKRKEGRVIRTQIKKNVKALKKNVQKIEKIKPKANGGENHREDIDEEVSLMGFYLDRLEKKIGGRAEQPLGKSIDFFTQEILRELNAASSKTKHKQCAALIVESKNYLERVREQAQNIE
ncbi:MAG: DUF1732 domain-containing protein [Candidatus Omnitrophica bacterium]|nr:DUF1732 domain-containing protein [Candidatus Omnitrophota bacterium]